MSWFFCADWHLWHANIIKYTRRPFLNDLEQDMMNLADKGTIPTNDFRISPESAKLMTDTIINSTNAVVEENDTIVHAGDLLFSPRDELIDRVRDFRKRLHCKNMILIWGNHDDSLWELYNLRGYFARDVFRWKAASEELRKLFPQVYDQNIFNVDGQKVFVNHYPMRSWDMAHHQAWNLYGHVHNLYKHEDNGKLAPYDEHVMSKGFKEILNNCLPESSDKDEIIKEMLEVAASLKGIDLTLDVGVDNTIRKDVLWGQPWSVPEIRDYMLNKKKKWEDRSEFYRNNQSRSTLKI